MKKTVIAVLAVLFSFTTTVVFADPGPYAGDVATDSCETEVGDPTVNTPCETGTIVEVYKAINKVFENATLASPGYDSNADTDAIQVTTSNTYWTDISGSGDASDFAFIGLTAGNSNTLGIYPFGSPGTPTYFPPAQTGFTYLGAGTEADPYPGAINTLSSVNFGFILKSEDGPDVEEWYSDPFLNADDIDHMLAFYLPELEGTVVYIDLDGDGVWTEGVDAKITLTNDTYLLAFEDRNSGHASFDNDYNDSIFLVTKVAPVPEPASMVLLGSGLAAMAGFRRRKNS